MCLSCVLTADAVHDAYVNIREVHCRCHAHLLVHPVVYALSAMDGTVAHHTRHTVLVLISSHTKILIFGIKIGVKLLYIQFGHGVVGENERNDDVVHFSARHVVMQIAFGRVRDGMPQVLPCSTTHQSLHRQILQVVFVCGSRSR